MKKRFKNLRPVAIGSAIVLGLILLISGTGKLPGQTEFADALLQSFWTPSVAYFIAHYLPWIEAVLGVFLVLGDLSSNVALVVNLHQ